MPDPRWRCFQRRSSRRSAGIADSGDRRKDSCRLTVTHDQLRQDANAELYGGWPTVLSGLKRLLETGERLTTPGSLQYLKA